MRALGTILIVEDEPDIRVALSELLEAEGYDAISASHGLDALGILAGISPPSLVLLDWRMPIMDGEHFLKHLRAWEGFKHVPVLVMTADHSVTWSTNELVLRKPFEFETLLEAIAALKLPPT